MDGVVPCSFALATGVGFGYALLLAEGGHTALMPNEVVVVQARLDEADAQSDTGFGVSLLSHWVVLKPGWFRFGLMTEPVAEAVEGLKDL